MFKRKLNEAFPEVLLCVTLSKPQKRSFLHHRLVFLLFFCFCFCFLQGKEFTEMCRGHRMSPVWQIEIKLGFNILRWTQPAYQNVVFSGIGFPSSSVGPPTLEIFQLWRVRKMSR